MSAILLIFTDLEITSASGAWILDSFRRSWPPNWEPMRAPSTIGRRAGTRQGCARFPVFWPSLDTTRRRRDRALAASSDSDLFERGISANPGRQGRSVAMAVTSPPDRHRAAGSTSREGSAPAAGSARWLDRQCIRLIRGGLWRSDGRAPDSCALAVSSRPRISLAHFPPEGDPYVMKPDRVDRLRVRAISARASREKMRRSSGRGGDHQEGETACEKHWRSRFVFQDGARRAR
jgi:hypothetical protein